MATSRILALCVVALLVSAVLATPLPQPLLVQPRQGHRSLYEPSTVRALAGSYHTFRYYFQKRNLDWLDAQFTSISDPTHENYRNFLTRDAIDAQVLPSAATKQPVLDFFASHGIGGNSLVQKDAILYVTAPVSTVERMFNTSLYVYPRKAADSASAASTGRVASAILRSPHAVSVPAVLAEPMWFIQGLNDLPPKVAGKDGTRITAHGLPKEL